MAETFPTPTGSGPRDAAALEPLASDLRPRGPDAALIALCRRCLAAEAALERLFAAECQAEERDDAAAQDRAARRRRHLLPLRASLRRRFAATPPTAVPGLRAKVRVYLSRCQHSDGAPTADGRDLHALCGEVLRLTEGGAWAGSGTPAPG